VPTYRFKCFNCGSHRDHSNVPVEQRDTYKPACGQCGGRTKRIIAAGITFSFAENCSPGESAKPASYWENAERVRLAGLKKREDEQKEKLRYDPNEQAKVALAEARHEAAVNEPD
jgi:hypothetical protein